MRRKKLWKKISYIAVSGTLAAATPVSAMVPYILASAQESDADISGMSQSESLQTEPLQTNPPQTNPPESNPPQTNPPESNPPQTNPPESNPPESNPPQTNPPESNPPESNPSETNSPESNPPESNPPETGSPDTEPETEPGTESGTETNPPQTETSPEQTESGTESDTVVTEPETEDGETESETTAQSDSEQNTEEFTEPVLPEETETESETASESESETESEMDDHSELNANYKTNIIASNASYLGQLSSAYGITIADGFGTVMEEVEAEFAQTLTDPENFHATNWRDVFAVFVYELKRQTGSAHINANTKDFLLEIFTRMNAPSAALGLEPRALEIEDVFVPEYSIEEELIRINVREELILAGWALVPGDAGRRAEALAQESAEQARQEQELLQQAEMEKDRYEKWLRQKQQQELADGKPTTSYAVADTQARTISDYAQTYGIGAEGEAEILRYASAECLQLCAIASAAPQIVRASVGDEVSEERVRIVTAAYSLVGKVGYFWGGKSFTFGWDSRWGSQATVTAGGSTSTGMQRKYGLDCSGYTLYCYYNGLNGGDAGIGGHTTSQWNASEMVDQSSAQPGDLVFYGGPERGDMNHVGVVVGKSSDGGLIVAHCSSSRNGVVVGEAWSSGFRYVRTVPSLK